MSAHQDKASPQGQAEDPSTAVTASKCAVTNERPLATGIQHKIQDPGQARARVAVSTDRPHGDVAFARKHEGYTVLQQHVRYFDTDNDGVIWVSDTYNGFRDLGFAIPFCAFCSPIIHAAFSWGTRVGTMWPDVLFRIFVDGIHQAKHGSDTGVYDPEGRFRPQLFEEIFSKYSRSGDGALTYDEMHNMRKGNRVAADVFGATTAWFEWSTIWLLLQKDGRVWKEDLRGIYDGSLMYRIREERRREKRNRNDWGFGPDGYFRKWWQ